MYPWSLVAMKMSPLRDSEPLPSIHDCGSRLVSDGMRQLSGAWLNRGSSTVTATGSMTNGCAVAAADMPEREYSKLAPVENFISGPGEPESAFTLGIAVLARPLNVRSSDTCAGTRSTVLPFLSNMRTHVATFIEAFLPPESRRALN